MRGKIFSASLNTSHILLKDRDGLPKVFGTLSLKKSNQNSSETFLHAHGNILRRPSPSRVFLEELMLCRGADICDVQRAIHLGYRDLNLDANLKLYMNMVLERERKRSAF